jgi:hypothetical protein
VIASFGACAVAIAMAVVIAAQGGVMGGGIGGGTSSTVGGGQGGGQRGGGFAGGGGFQMPTRLAMLTSAFKLEKEQVQAVKSILDDAAKDPAVPAVRAELTTTYAAIGVAIEKGASPDAVDAAVKTYAAVSQKMADLELAALAKIVKSLTDTQRGNTTAMTSAVSVMRGAFLDKKWDVTPGASSY